MFSLTDIELKENSSMIEYLLLLQMPPSTQYPTIALLLDGVLPRPNGPHKS